MNIENVLSLSLSISAPQCHGNAGRRRRRRRHQSLAIVDALSPILYTWSHAYPASRTSVAWNKCGLKKHVERKQLEFIFDTRDRCFCSSALSGPTLMTFILPAQDHHRITTNCWKCNPIQLEIGFLGHHIDKHGISLRRKRTQINCVLLHSTNQSEFPLISLAW